jgi:hypothetical protein
VDLDARREVKGKSKKTQPARADVRKRHDVPQNSAELVTRRIDEIDRLLKEDARAGRLDGDPDFRDRILRDGFDILHELELMVHDPQWPRGARTLARFKVAEHVLQPLRYIEGGGEGGNTKIEISIAAWAAGPGIEGPPRPIELQPAIDVTANDPELEAHGRSSAPAPDVPNPAPINERHAPGAELFEVERGADGLAHAVRVRHEQPAPNDDRWETIRDNATGTDIKVRIHG